MDKKAEGYLTREELVPEEGNLERREDKENILLYLICISEWWVFESPGVGENF